MTRDALIQWIDDHTDEMVRDFQSLLRAESVRSEESLPGAPFGKGVRDALDVT
jgi:hypothetical protein